MIQGKGLDVSQAIKDHISKKLGPLSTFDEYIREIDVRLSSRDGKGPKMAKAELTVFTKLKNVIVRAEKEHTDGNLYAAIDDVSDTVSRKMRKLKEERVKRQGARGEEKITEHLPIEPPELSTAEPVAHGNPTLPTEVIRTKYFHAGEPLGRGCVAIPVIGRAPSFEPS